MYLKTTISLYTMLTSSETIKVVTPILSKIHLLTSDLSKATKFSKSSSSMIYHQRRKDHRVIGVIENKKT